MCLMAPVQVIRTADDSCEVAWAGHTEWISTLAVDGRRLAAGDWVLIVGGQAVKRLDADGAAAMSAALGVASAAPRNGGRTT